MFGIPVVDIILQIVGIVTVSGFLAWVAVTILIIVIFSKKAKEA